MKFAHKFKKRELLFIWFCLIIIAVIFTDKVIQRMNLKFNRLEEEITLNQEKLFRLNAILKQAKELDAQYQKSFSGYKELKDSDSLLREIANIAKRVNINILNIKPGATKEEGLYKIYSIKMEFEEEVASLAKFLHTLSEELKSISIEGLQINTQDKNELPKASVLINAAAFKG